MNILFGPKVLYISSDFQKCNLNRKFFWIKLRSKKLDRIQERNIFPRGPRGFVFLFRSHLAMANNVCILGGLRGFSAIFKPRGYEVEKIFQPRGFEKKLFCHLAIWWMSLVAVFGWVSLVWGFWCLRKFWNKFGVGFWLGKSNALRGTGW